VPDDIAALPKPVIGFVGAISDYKLNSEWLQALAAARRDWSIALIGPVGVGDEHTDVARLRDHPNIHLLGHRPYATLPGYVKGFDVAMIPYRLNEYTRYSFPIKFFELLSSGKPVVISPLEAVAAYHDAVLVAHDVDELVARCEQALAQPNEGLEQRLELADANTWSSRVERLWSEVERRLV
jgi:glycosyltransferase involved in cell wall biosynthesis